MKTFKKKFILKVFVLLGVLLITNSTIFASNNPIKDREEITFVLSTYKNAIENNSYKIMAKCSPPPMDKVHIANEKMYESFLKFSSAYEKAWGNQLIPGVNLDYFKIHPLSYLTSYNFTNIEINGEKAFANVELTVNSEKKYSKQNLAKINGKWFVVQKDGTPEYSAEDNLKLINLASLLQQLSNFMGDIIEKIKHGEVSQEECLRLVQEKIYEIERKKTEI